MRIILACVRWVITVVLRLAIGILEIVAWSVSAIERPTFAPRLAPRIAPARSVPPRRSGPRRPPPY